MARSELQALKAQTAQTSAEAIAHDGRELPKALGQPREAGISEPSASAKLIARAEQLLRDQDIGGARLLLERAAKSDNWAVFLLAETYDPQVLADRKVIGVSGDRTKARELYLRASSGIPEAQERAEGLRQQLAAARHEIETLKSNSADVDVRRSRIPSGGAGFACVGCSYGRFQRTGLSDRTHSDWQYF